MSLECSKTCKVPEGRKKLAETSISTSQRMRKREPKEAHRDMTSDRHKPSKKSTGLVTRSLKRCRLRRRQCWWEVLQSAEEPVALTRCGGVEGHQTLRLVHGIARRRGTHREGSGAPRFPLLLLLFPLLLLSRWARRQAISKTGRASAAGFDLQRLMGRRSRYSLTCPIALGNPDSRRNGSKKHT